MVSLLTHICITQPQWVNLSISLNVIRLSYQLCYKKVLLYSYRDYFVYPPANERQLYIVPSPPIGWAQTQNDPCTYEKGNHRENYYLNQKKIKALKDYYHSEPLHTRLQSTHTQHTSKNRVIPLARNKTLACGRIGYVTLVAITRTTILMLCF